MHRSFDIRLACCLFLACASLAACGGDPAHPTLPSSPPPAVATMHLTWEYGAKRLVEGATIFSGVSGHEPSVGSGGSLPNLHWSSSSSAVVIDQGNGNGVQITARHAGIAQVTAHGAGTDTLRVVITVYPRPTVSTPLADAPISVQEFTVMQRLPYGEDADESVFFYPVATLAARGSGSAWVLEAVVEVPGVAWNIRCTTARRLAQAEPIFPLTSAGLFAWAVSFQDVHPTGSAVLHLVLLDAQEKTVRVDVPGSVVPYDYRTPPPARQASDDWSHISCGPSL